MTKLQARFRRNGADTKLPLLLPLRRNIAAAAPGTVAHPASMAAHRAAASHSHSRCRHPTSTRPPTTVTASGSVRRTERGREGHPPSTIELAAAPLYSTSFRFCDPHARFSPARMHFLFFFYLLVHSRNTQRIFHSATLFQKTILSVRMRGD